MHPLKKSFGLGMVSIGVVVALLFVVFSKKETPVLEEPPVHFHAGFQVYVDDALQDFSDIKYMQIKPCGDAVHEANDQIEKAHLHGGVGDVVHVHREGALWKDLFVNLPYEMPASVVGYVNGQRVPEVLSMPILKNASVVFFVGENTDIQEKVAARVSSKRIEEVALQSETCAVE